MIRRKGMGRRGGIRRVGCLALVSAFLPELSLLRLRGLDGCSCQVRMALSICRRLESLMPRAGGRRHETLADSRVQVPRAGTPGSFRNHGRASASTPQYHTTGGTSHGRGLHNDRPRRCSLSTAGVGYRGLVIGGVELRPLGPDYIGEEGSRTTAA